MKGVNYARLQVAILGLIVLYGIAMLCGLQVPAANKPEVDKVLTILFVLLSADNLKRRITEDPPEVDPTVKKLMDFQGAVQKVAASVNPKE